MQTLIYHHASAVMLLVALSACASSRHIETAHEVLNVITDVAQPSYDVTAGFCTQAQWAITRDRDRTVQQKKAAVAKLRTECHRIYAIFEQIIDKQKKARALLNAAETVEDIVRAAAEVDAIRSLLQQAQSAAAALQQKDPRQ